MTDQPATTETFPTPAAPSAELGETIAEFPGRAAGYAEALTDALGDAVSLEQVRNAITEVLSGAHDETPATD